MKRLIIFISACLILFVHSFAAENSASVDSITYNKDKSITVYGTVNGGADDFGISLNYDEKSEDFSNSLRFKAYGGANSEGKFGVVIPYSEFAADGVFNLKAYTVSADGAVTYSGNTLTADADSEHSRIPALSSAVPYEGELYPAFSKDIREYYVLVDKLPAEPLEIHYKAENANDNVTLIPASTVADDVVIKLSGDFNENTYRFSYRLKKTAILKPSSYLIKEEGAAPYIGSALKLSENAVNHISFDSFLMPEKYVPTGVYLSVKGVEGRGITVAASTEPAVKIGDLSLMTSEYVPQMGDETRGILLSGETEIKLNEKEFKSRSFLKVALSAGEDSAIKEISLKVSYFEDIPLPVIDKTKDSAELAAIYVEGANELYPEFRSDVYEYYAVFDKLPGKVPAISCIASNPSAKVEVSDASVISGETTLKVTFGENANTYTVKFREYKEADMELSVTMAKRTPYELFNMKIPQTGSNPYYSYIGRMENEFGTSHSHLATMAFNTSNVQDTNIHISAAELTMFATTNCTEGMYVDFYRCTNTAWPDGATADKRFFATANHFVPRGAEGKLNGETLIKHTGGMVNAEDFRYYTIPMKTEGFTDAKSINLYILAQWQKKNPPNSTYQNIYVWMGKNGIKTEDGMGMLPNMHIKYFLK